MLKYETSFYRRVNKRLPAEIHAEKMTNPYRGGTADFWYSGYKADLWAEYKWFKAAPVRSAKVGLQPLQELWLNDALRKRRSVCVIIGSPQGCAILLDGAWMDNVSREDFMYTEEGVASWITGKVDAPLAILESSYSSDEHDLQTVNDIDANSRNKH